MIYSETQVIRISEGSHFHYRHMGDNRVDIEATNDEDILITFLGDRTTQVGDRFQITIEKSEN